MTGRGEILALLHGAAGRWRTLAGTVDLHRTLPAHRAERRTYRFEARSGDQAGPGAFDYRIETATGDDREVHGRSGGAAWSWTAGRGFAGPGAWPGPVPEMIEPTLVLDRFQIAGATNAETWAGRAGHLVLVRYHERRAPERTLDDSWEEWLVDSATGILLRRRMAGPDVDLEYAVGSLAVDHPAEEGFEPDPAMAGDVRLDPSQAAEWVDSTPAEAAAAVPFPVLLPSAGPVGTTAGLQVLTGPEPRVRVRFERPPGPLTLATVDLHAAAGVRDLDEQRLPWRQVSGGPVVLHVRAGQPRGSLPTLHVRAERMGTVAFVRGVIPVEHLVDIAAGLTPWRAR